MQPKKERGSNYSCLVSKYMNNQKKTVSYNRTDLKEQRLFEVKDSDDEKTRKMKQSRLDIKEREG